MIAKFTATLVGVFSFEGLCFGIAGLATMLVFFGIAYFFPLKRISSLYTESVGMALFFLINGLIYIHLGETEAISFALGGLLTFPLNSPLEVLMINIETKLLNKRRRKNEHQNTE